MRILLLLIAVAALAFASKPGPERFERHLSEAYAQARNENAKQEKYIETLLAIGVGALREGKYDDYIFASRFRVELLGKPLAVCYGYFGQISCQNAS